MKSQIRKDKKRRKLIKDYEVSRRQLKALIYDRQHLTNAVRFNAMVRLAELPRSSSHVRARNRCIFTGRGNSVYRQFKLSRIRLRELASMGLLPGVYKSSW